MAGDSEVADRHGKRTQTLTFEGERASEIKVPVVVPDSDTEQESKGEMPQESKRVNSIVSTRQQQLTFNDLKWKCLETEEEKEEQKKRMKRLDEEMWGPMVHEDKDTRVLQKQAHKRQLAAKRQQRWRAWQHVTGANDHGKTVNMVSGFLLRKGDLMTET